MKQIVFYPCKICGQQFKWRELLRRHLVVHTAETVTCPDCHKKFPTKEKLNQHRLKSCSNHGNESESLDFKKARVKSKAIENDTAAAFNFSNNVQPSANVTTNNEISNNAVGFGEFANSVGIEQQGLSSMAAYPNTQQMQHFTDNPNSQSAANYMFSLWNT